MSNENYNKNLKLMIKIKFSNQLLSCFKKIFLYGVRNHK